MPSALSAVAYLTVLAIALSLFALIAWALLRVDSGGRGEPPRRQDRGLSHGTSLKQHEIGEVTRRIIW